MLSVNDFDSIESPIIIKDRITYGNKVQAILLHLFEVDAKDPLPPIVVSLHGPKFNGNKEQTRKINAEHIVNAINFCVGRLAPRILYVLMDNSDLNATAKLINEKLPVEKKISIIRCSYHIIENFFNIFFKKQRTILINNGTRQLDISKALIFFMDQSKKTENQELKFLLQNFSDILCFANTGYVKKKINFNHSFIQKCYEF